MTKRPPVPSEAEVLKTCMAIANALGVPCFRRNIMAMSGTYNGKQRFIRSGEAGQADLWGFLPGSGKHWECEVKRRGNKPSPAQSAWLSKCWELGAAVNWVDTPQDFEQWLKNLMGENVSCDRLTR